MPELQLPLPPRPRFRMNAWPSEKHKVPDEIKINWTTYKTSEILDFTDRDHRSWFCKELIKSANQWIFEMFWIPEELRDAEFTTLEETPDWFHVCYTNSGSDWMARTVRWVCDVD